MHTAPPSLAFLSILLPVVNILISLPLCLRLMPPNRWYGFRTRKTMSNPEIWYEANYKGGIGLIVASLIALAGRAAIMKSFEPPTSDIVAVFALLGCMVVALVVWGVQLKRM